MTKTAFIAIVGRPNVGKSTLLNSILGEKVSIVSKKPQTTRNRITGIHTVGENQYVFLDTPGIHKPRTRLGDYMVKASTDAIGGTDGAILVVEAREEVGDIEKEIMDRLKRENIPTVLVINKTDCVHKENIAKTIKAYADAFDFMAVVPTSAKSGKGVDTVVSECEKLLHESPWFFPDDIVTDQPERVMAAEIIREKLLRTLDEEIPHGTAVVIEEWKEKRDLVSIRAEIYCEKDTHKGIIIGKGGTAIKTVGSYARQDIENMLGVKVFLDLYVRVKKNWRDNEFNLQNFGFADEE